MVDPCNAASKLLELFPFSCLSFGIPAGAGVLAAEDVGEEDEELVDVGLVDPCDFDSFFSFSFLIFGLNSVITTVKSLTVTLWYVALFLSTFLNFALLMGFFDSFFFSFGGFSFDKRLFAFKLASAAKSLSSSSSSSPISSSSTDAGDFTPEEDGPGVPEEPAKRDAGGGVRACACC